MRASPLQVGIINWHELETGLFSLVLGADSGGELEACFRDCE